MRDRTRRTIVALTTSFPLRPSDWAGIFIQRLYAQLDGTHVNVVCPADDRTSELLEPAHVAVHAARYAPRRWQSLAQRSGGVVPGLKKHPWRILLLPGLLLSMVYSAWRLGRRGDLVHANWAVCGALASVVASLLRIPLVTTLRGDDVKRAVASRVDRWLLSLACQRSEAVICVSDAMASGLRARFPSLAGKVHVVRNGVDDSFLATEHVPRAAGTPMRIGAVGSLIHRKGFDVLINAIHEMRDRNVSLSVIGAGPEQGSLQALTARLGLQDRVTFLGEIPPPSMPAFLASVDLFVLSSRSEGRPNVVIEALAAGVPVVSTDLPGVAGLVVDGVGWIVPVDDAPALASALDVACSDPAHLLVMGQLARLRAAADGGWRRAAGEYDAIFDSVIRDYRRKH